MNNKFPLNGDVGLVNIGQRKENAQFAGIDSAADCLNEWSRETLIYDRLCYHEMSFEICQYFKR